MDCNNFFVSCERLFRPDLINKPVAVLSSNDGCIVARSQEVKDLGIPMGIPYFKVADFCKEKNITLFSSNFELYRDISKRVMSALENECDVCEIYSIDEAFFNIGSNVKKDEVLKIKTNITQKTGIPVSIGISSTKTLAKIANNAAKKGEGIQVLKEKDRKAFLENIKCGSVWGIGRQTSACLQRENISLVSEFLSCEQSYVKNLLGVVGERLYFELSGTPVFMVGKQTDQTQESYTSSRSFAEVTHERSVLMSALSNHVTTLAEKLRKSESVASSISILVRGSRFGSYSHRPANIRSVLPIPTSDTVLLIKEISELLDKIYDSKIPYKKAGVTLSGIKPEELIQNSLFDKKNNEPNKKTISYLLDEINNNNGNGSLRFAVTLGKNSWKEKKELKSSDYTTSWSEIPRVKAT